MCLSGARPHPSPKVFGNRKGVQGETGQEKAPEIPDACTKGFQDKMLAKSVRIHEAMNVRPQ